MRRIRAAVTHIDINFSPWPSTSYGAARFATPPTPRTTRNFVLLFPLPPPRVQTGQYLQQPRTTEWHRAGRNSNLEKIVGNFAKI